MPGSSSSQPASGSGNSLRRTPRQLNWSEAIEEGEASEQRVSGGKVGNKATLGNIKNF